MEKFVCISCGYVHEGEAAPKKCPGCGRERRLKKMAVSSIDTVIKQIRAAKNPMHPKYKYIHADIIGALEYLKKYETSVTPEEVYSITDPDNRVYGRDYENLVSQYDDYGIEYSDYSEYDKEFLYNYDYIGLPYLESLYVFRKGSYILLSVELDNGFYSDIFALNVNMKVYQDTQFCPFSQSCVIAEKGNEVLCISAKVFEDIGYEVYKYNRTELFSEEVLAEECYLPTKERLLEYAKEEGWI